MVRRIILIELKKGIFFKGSRRRFLSEGLRIEIQMRSHIHFFKLSLSEAIGYFSELHQSKNHLQMALNANCSSKLNCDRPLIHEEPIPSPLLL